MACVIAVLYRYDVAQRCLNQAKAAAFYEAYWNLIRDKFGAIGCSLRGGSRLEWTHNKLLIVRSKQIIRSSRFKILM